MRELVLIRNDVAMCDSLQVAEKFHKRHDNVLRSIEGLLKNEETHEMFILKTYVEEQNGQAYPMYYMNRDGFSLLAMGFTGKEALYWKLEYIKAFNTLEFMLLEHQSPVWKDTRAYAKEIRKQEAEAIKELVEYAISNGSTHAKTYYTSLSTLADKAAGIQRGKRDQSSIAQLNVLSLVERIIAACIHEGVSQGISYKDIYKACKERAEDFQAVIASTGSRAVN